jgi:putative acetyltransferase
VSIACAIRPLAPADADVADGIIARAFGRRAEADLVRALRAEEPALVELVAVAEGRVIGHVSFSPVRVDRLAPGVVAYGLAPVSVEPALQKSGAGGRMIEAGFAACRDRGAGVVFVLGHASYYPRFGFMPALAHGFRYRSADFDRSFFVRELVPGAAADGGGLVHFHPAFDRF